jgi:hypothetical protein
MGYLGTWYLGTWYFGNFGGLAETQEHGFLRIV